MNELKKRDTKGEKIKLCDYCQEQIIGDPTFDRATLCVVERNYPSREDYLKNPNSEAKDIIYHQDCYKEKHCIINNISDLRKMVRRTMITFQQAPKEAFKDKNNKGCIL